MPFISEIPISYEGLLVLAVIGLVWSLRRHAQRKGPQAEQIDLLESERRCGVISIPPGTKFGNS